MYNAILASTALLATTALAGSAGKAVVINKCSYAVHLENTPASGGGYETIVQSLKSNGRYSQDWTQLSNGNGWSLKLGQSAGMSNIMQYEYTFHDDGTIWYDLSDVNGNPWDGNWEITASGDCTPKQQAYRYATDDAYGMQSCAQDSTITVTLCSGDAAPKGGSPPASPAPVESSASPVETSTAAAYSSATTEAASSPTWGGWSGQGGLVGNKNVEAASPTTFATHAVNKGSGVTVTNVQTEVVTNFVTATAVAKRHQHHRHPHNRV